MFNRNPDDPRKPLNKIWGNLIKLSTYYAVYEASMRILAFVESYFNGLAGMELILSLWK